MTESYQLGIAHPGVQFLLCPLHCTQRKVECQRITDAVIYEYTHYNILFILMLMK